MWYKVTGTANATGLLPEFLRKENAKYQTWMKIKLQSWCFFLSPSSWERWFLILPLGLRTLILFLLEPCDIKYTCLNVCRFYWFSTASDHVSGSGFQHDSHTCKPTCPSSVERTHRLAEVIHCVCKAVILIPLCPFKCNESTHGRGGSFPSRMPVPEAQSSDLSLLLPLILH